MSRPLRLLSFSLAGALVCAAAGGAPVPPSAAVAPAAKPVEKSGLVERVTSELVLVEAYVSERDGRPVRGLGPQDFVLMIDGHLKPIASVEFRQAAAPENGPRIPPAAEQRPEETAPASSPRRFVLFFEDGTSAFEGLTAARRAAQTFLTATLTADDQVALAAYDRRLRVLHDFTADRGALFRAIEASLADPQRMSDFPDQLLKRQEDFTRLLADPGLMTSTGGRIATGKNSHDVTARQAATLAGSYAVDEAARWRQVLGAVRTLVDALSGWPGYRAIVFMGDGVPEDPAQDYLERIVGRHNPYQPTGASNLSFEIKELAHAAAAAGVTIHTVQTAGLSTGSAREVRAALRRSNALEAIALNTGGLTSSSNDLSKGLAQAEAASRAYYIIGYAPEGPPDGLEHTVQLRVRRSGVRLSWRHEFTRLRPAEARQRAIQAAHLMPEFYRDMDLDLSVVPGPAGAGQQVTDLVAHLPGDKVLFLPEDGRPTARLEVGFVALDASQHETLRIARSLRLALPPDAPQGQGGTGLDLYSRVRLPVSAQTVTAVVADVASGTIGAARLVLPKDWGAEHDILGLSIYSLAERSVWVEVPAGGAGGEEPQQASAFDIGPALKATFASGEPLACGFRTSQARAPGDPALRLLIRRGDLAVRTVEVADGSADPGGTVKRPLPVQGLAAGDYTLVVQEVQEQGPIDRASLPFRIR